MEEFLQVTFSVWNAPKVYNDNNQEKLVVSQRTESAVALLDAAT